jgi:hypothetical protein
MNLFILFFLLLIDRSARAVQVRAGSNEEANRHTMLRPRHWWEAKFREHGAVVDKEMVWALQEKDAHFSDKEVGLGTLFAYGTVFWEWGLVLFEGGASYCYDLPLACSNKAPQSNAGRVVWRVGRGQQSFTLFGPPTSICPRRKSTPLI